MKNIRDFYLKNFQFLDMKLSIYLNRRVFVMTCPLIAFAMATTSGQLLADRESSP